MRPGRGKFIRLRWSWIFLALAPAGSTQAYLVDQVWGTGQMGRAVARLGDLDGDGVSELVAGAPYASPGGQAHVFAGATLSLLFSTTGSGAGDLLGWSVARTGDLSGDGIPDLLAGAPQGTNFSTTGSGYARVLSGVDGSTVLTVSGAAATDLFGHSVAGLGDVDGDGLDDLLVGAPQFGAGTDGAGYAKIFSGADGSVLRLVAGSVGPSPFGGDQFGFAVAGVGDVNADGSPDFAVGAPEADPGGLLGAGEAKVFSGLTGGLLFALAGGVGDHLGYAISGCGDVNGDGKVDVFVGAPQFPGSSLGYARLYSGDSGAPLFSFYGSAIGDRFGEAVAGVGDIDADGVPDLAVGAPQAFSNSVPPTGGGYARVYSGASGSALLTHSAGQPGARYGTAIVGAGDVDGDDFEDLFVGSPRYPDGNFSGGMVQTIAYVGTVGSPYGFGCAGSGGFVPRLRTAGGYPTAGSGNPKFRFALSHALGGAPAVLVLGISSYVWFGLPLPHNLGTLGLSSCWLFCSTEAFFPVVTSGVGPGQGRALVATPIPAAPALVGAHHFFQWYVVDPGPLLLPGALSGALDLSYF